MSYTCCTCYFMSFWYNRRHEMLSLWPPVPSVWCRAHNTPLKTWRVPRLLRHNLVSCEMGSLGAVRYHLVPFL